MVAWGPIIGAGISMLGSLFGGKKKEEKQEVDYVAMAAAAEKAGFNPLTVLRNGGSAGFTNVIHPALSGADKFGSALGILGNALMSFDARADERAELELALMRKQLAGVPRGGGYVGFGDVPQATGSRYSTTPGQNGRVTSPLLVDVELGPHTSAQKVEDEYGDIVGGVYGVTRWFRDWRESPEGPGSVGPAFWKAVEAAGKKVAPPPPGSFGLPSISWPEWEAWVPKGQNQRRGF